jgi:hypothetical protein
MKCEFKWNAPYFHAPPSKEVTMIQQACSLQNGHEGSHRSFTNVIHPNDGSVNIDRPSWDRRIQL